MVDISTGGNTVPAQLIYKKREVLKGENEFADIVVWAVAPSVLGSYHGYKYRLAYVVNGVCVMRYDNEAGKGDHKHIGGSELPVMFSDLTDLIEQFYADIQALRS
ncbi:DUF6516 family protein [Edwardsiella ictaluri]|uniref:toxin-antitoxin system TumE family protein n=1 Tax=Edwardsiella ictaluri TaxID=67780 RepID=UPI003783BEB5